MIFQLTEGNNSMVQIKKYDDNFFTVLQNTKRKLVLYGMGNVAQMIYPYLSNVSYVCDQKADGQKLFHDILVVKPEELQNIEEKLIILICIMDRRIRQEVKKSIMQLDIDALVFEYPDNIAFHYFSDTQYKRAQKDISYVRLICNDQGWILSKFAHKMKEQLELRGIRAEIAECIDLTADINHHIPYHQYRPVRECNDTLMITHVDSLQKLTLLKKQLQVAKMGICMSRDTMKTLVSYGVPREKLCYINPAQDGMIKPKKYIVGITHRNYEMVDNRKRIHALVDIGGQLDPDYFHFKIMGAGWDKIVKQMRCMGFEIDYYADFDYDVYVRMIQTLDYYLFWGFDEGSMGYLDALAAGVETIVTPQGYHLDIRNGIDYPCRIVQDFIDVLSELQNKRKRKAASVEGLTWEHYVEKHLEVWHYLLGNDDAILKNKHLYEDGIFSVLNVEA